jgi:hypothetical protein
MSKRPTPPIARHITPTLEGHGPFQAWTSDAFATTDFSPDWLVPGVLAAGLPGVLGGPRKAFKTSLMVDLAVSIATATPFLGQFPVPASRRVAIFSGERDPAGLRDTARRVCGARGAVLKRCTISWAFRPPRLYDEAELSALKEFLTASRTEVVFIDPLYLCLLAPGGAEAAANLYHVGPVLDRAAGACLSAGATPVFVHHTTKWTGQSEYYHDPDLGALAYAGIAEFVRQWVLLYRRTGGTRTPGQHRLSMAIGGTPGHGGRWEVEIDERSAGELTTDRSWQVDVREPPPPRARTGRMKAIDRDTPVGDIELTFE